MKRLLKLLMLSLLFSLLSLNFGEETIAKMSITYTLTGEITNTNPYSIFVAVPSNITFEEKTLPKPKDFLDVSVSTTQTPGIVFYETVFNGKKGFWIPPYTTIKIGIYHYLPITYDIKVDESQENYDVVGPAVVNKVDVIDLNKLFPDAKYKGIKIGNFKLYVRGYIVKGNDTKSLSIIIPAPLVIENYDEFYKILGKGDVDIWERSYNDWYKNQMKRKNINIDNNDPLVPKMDDSLLLDNNINSEFKIFDVPIMAFTTSSSQPINFYYIIYKYTN
ncbi:hypothetical protein [Methanocaldococcus sp. FS406-22]|uniref:hypothetical protein n=1 Tax=Methanocaldococcus sp. (strain FS406-22) TaxID=644281 RepID=UPI000B0EC894|nr:hypothetical protein [Methanocaldococcus sp. FS406-22]